MRVILRLLTCTVLLMFISCKGTEVKVITIQELRAMPDFDATFLEKKESEYKAKIDRGKAPGKPLKDELMVQLIKKNPKLSETAFRRAWKNSDIPGLKKHGAPKRPRRSRR